MCLRLNVRSRYRMSTDHLKGFRYRRPWKRAGLLRSQRYNPGLKCRNKALELPKGLIGYRKYGNMVP